MKELKKAPWWVPVASVFLVLWVVNWLFVKLGWSPFLYCWGLAVAPWFAGWYQMVTLAVLLWFGWCAYRRAWFPMFGAGLAVTVVVGLPDFFDTAVRLGGTCQ